jgi:hypothetical protein
LKVLFIRIPLGAPLKKITLNEIVPYGLKPHECECSCGCNKPLISYIPKKDVKEVVETNATTFKQVLPQVGVESLCSL